MKQPERLPPAKKGCWLQLESAPLSFSGLTKHQLGDATLTATVHGAEKFLRVLPCGVQRADLVDHVVAAFCAAVASTSSLSALLVSIAHVFSMGTQVMVFISEAGTVVAAVQNLFAGLYRTVAQRVDHAMRRLFLSLVPGLAISLHNAICPNQARTKFRAVRRGRPLRGMIKQALQGALSCVHASGHNHLSA
jgi:hypothetical protein